MIAAGDRAQGGRRMPGGVRKVWSNPFVRKGLIAGGAAVLVYTLFGFLALPSILKSVLSKTLSETLHRKTELRDIRVNPLDPAWSENLLFMAKTIRENLK